MAKQHGWRFDKPLEIAVLQRTEVIALDGQGHPSTKMNQGIAEIKTPQALVDMATAAESFQFHIVPALSVQLFLLVWEKLGHIVPDDAGFTDTTASQRPA